MKKIFVLDTNVLLHDATSIFSFADNKIVLPMAVIEELDHFKKNNDELGRNSRQVIRKLDKLRAGGHLGSGVPMENGGTLQILAYWEFAPEPGLDPHIMDNRILRVAYSLHRNEKEGEVIFVSKDINARLKADALGMDAVDFEKEKVNYDELYSGYREVNIPGEQVDAFYENEVLEIEGPELCPNEFVLLKDLSKAKHTALARAVRTDAVAHLKPRFDGAWTIKSRSKEQRMALELLLDPAVRLVTLVGQAGTGKTLLALAAGLEMVVRQGAYARILVSRPVIPMGKDIGYLPGDKDEKMMHWMQPIFDNLVFLLREKGEEKATPNARKRVEELLHEKTVELEALTYIRGRSIPDQYVIIDEAQNLTPHEVKTIVSRAGEGTKMVLTGDPGQIDNPYLDSSSNGLSHAVERLRWQAIHGHITLRKSERSTLAAIAAEYL